MPADSTIITPETIVTPPDWRGRFLENVLRQNRPPFRGGLIENCARFKFRGGGYKSMPPEQNGHFCIESARQCTGPLLALGDDRVVIVHVIGATQVLKSMNGDIWVPYVLEHEQLPMLVLFEDEGKADLFCGMRLMDTLKQHPGLAPLLADTRKDSRHNVTGTWIKFQGFELLVAGLNDGNVSSLSWPRLWVSEAWQHNSDGLLQKAFKRADRYGDRAKILNESQASVAKTDLHRAVEKAHPVPLLWRCPACDGEQSWEWHHWNFKRPDDFVPRPQRRVSVATVGGNLAFIEETPNPGSYGGMIWPSSEDGKLSLDQIARQAHWECIHCGHHIHDTAAERKALCETYTQNYRRPDGTIPREVCFTVPFEAAWNNRFEQTVKDYLVAKRAKDQGLDIELQNWFLNNRALFYERGQTQALELQPVAGSYDPKEKIPDQHSVNMLVDVQKKLDAGPDEDVPGSFWVVVEAVDKLGNSRDLYRGFVTSWEDLIALQKRFGVPNGRFCIDGRKWTRVILQKAAANYEWVSVTLPHFKGRSFQARRCWMIFLGDDAPFFRHSRKGGGYIARTYSMPHEHRVTLMENGRSVSVPVYTYQWSNLAISDQLHEIMLGGEGMPKIETLSRDQLDPDTRLKEQGDFTYEKQINAEYRTERRGKPYWEKKRPENHYLDCRKMGLVRKQMDGLAGSVIEPPAPESPAALSAAIPGATDWPVTGNPSENPTS